VQEDPLPGAADVIENSRSCTYQHLPLVLRSERVYAPADLSFLTPRSGASSRAAGTTADCGADMSSKYELGGRKIATMKERKYVIELCLVLAAVAQVYASTPEVLWQFDTAG
jgi:hypothetical protein